MLQEGDCCVAGAHRGHHIHRHPDVQAEGDFAILNAGHPMAEFFRLSTLQVRDRIVGSGAVSAAQFDAAIALFEDPGAVA